MVTAKRLALLLVAANTVFFLWAQFGREVDTGVSRKDTFSPIERLVLREELPSLSELSTPASRAELAAHAESKDAASGTIVAADASPVVSCYRIGPFVDRQAAREFSDRWRVRGRIEAESRSRIEGYWIMYPPAETLAVARRNLERLKAMGWQDLWLFEQGPWQGAISLGMYAELERAKTLAEKLRERGLEVRVMPKEQELTHYWLWVEGGFPMPEQEMPLGLTAVPCPVPLPERQ